jgi:hypothetical protein
MLHRAPSDSLAGRFNNTRARFQRLGDAKLLYGWVQEVTEQKVVVEIDSEVSLQVGDQFQFDLIGFSRRVMFQAALVAATNGRYGFRLTSRPQFAAVSESVRVSLRGVGVTIESPDGPKTATVLDASPGGMGLLLDEKPSAGEEMTLRFNTSPETITARVVVRYARPTPDGKRFRAGVQILEMNRIDRGRWMKLFEGLA